MLERIDEKTVREVTEVTLKHDIDELRARLALVEDHITNTQSQLQGLEEEKQTLLSRIEQFEALPISR